MLIKKNVLILHPADKSACTFSRCRTSSQDSKSYLERWLRSWFGETLVVNG